jgi:hypothetical protein
MGAHIDEPLLPGPSYGQTTSQIDVATLEGQFGLGLHFGVGLDYWVTQRFIMGVTVDYDVPIIGVPTIRLLQVSDGSFFGVRERFGYFSIGPRLTLRL